MNTTLLQVISLKIWRVRKGVIQVSKFMIALNRPFKAFSAAVIGLKVHIKSLNAKPITNINGAKCFNCIFNR